VRFQGVHLAIHLILFYATWVREIVNMSLLPWWLFNDRPWFLLMRLLLIMKLPLGNIYISIQCTVHCASMRHHLYGLLRSLSVFVSE
jgi:hypothetical protein